MAKDDDVFAERSRYAANKKLKAGWNISTQPDDRLFNGQLPRPMVFQCGNSAKIRARSGPRSIERWQRDYHSQGVPEKTMEFFRYQRFLRLRDRAVAEAERRSVPVNVIEEEMMQGMRSMPESLQDIRQDSRKLEDLDGYAFIADCDVFRGDEWQRMSEALMKCDMFNPPVRSNTLGSDNGTSRASGVTMEELSRRLKSKARAAKDPVGRQCSRDLEDLKVLLLQNYGSLFGSWRNLDAEGTGKISYQDFCKSLKDLTKNGFSVTHSLRAAFASMDPRHTGFVTFSDFAPDVAARITTFSKLLLNTYAADTQEVNWDYVWKRILRIEDKDGNRQLSFDELKGICQSIGYKDDPKEVFNELRLHSGRRYLSQDDIKAIPMLK